MMGAGGGGFLLAYAPDPEPVRAAMAAIGAPELTFDVDDARRRGGIGSAAWRRDLGLGLNTGYWTSGPPPGAQEAVAEADKLGFHSIWTAEAYGSDALTPLAWWGAATENVQLGTAIMQMSARQPAAAAMAAMTMDHLSGGRFILGVGVSGPQVVEGWYGQPFAKPLARTREYVAIVRDIVARGDRVDRARPALPAALPGGHRAGQAAEVHAAPGPRPDPDLPRRRGAEERGAGRARSATAGWRSSSPPSTRTSTATR